MTKSEYYIKIYKEAEFNEKKNMKAVNTIKLAACSMCCLKSCCDKIYQAGLVLHLV